MANIINPIAAAAGPAFAPDQTCVHGSRHGASGCDEPFPLAAVNSPPVPKSVTQSGTQPAQTGTADVAKEFETMVVSFMLKDVVENDLKGVLGEGAGGDFYISVFTDALARQIVEAGGIGIQQQVGSASND